MATKPITIAHPTEGTHVTGLPHLRKTTGNKLPIFLELDKDKYAIARNLLDMGHRMVLEVQKQEIYPQHCQEAALKAATNPHEIERVLRVNEMLLDMRIVGNMGADLDHTVKNAILEYPCLKTGLAILNEHNYVFTECDTIGGVARDIKKVLKRVQDIVEQETGARPPFGAIMPSYLLIPFEGSKLDYGTWGRPAVIDDNVNSSTNKLTLSLLEVDVVKRFFVDDKKHNGMHTTDVTENVNRVVSESNMRDGYAIITTMHTTVGINKMDPKHKKQLYEDLLKIAPDDSSLYYHNVLAKRGELKLRTDGKPFGDGNGQSHVWASLIGSYTIVPFRGGVLSLENGERILHHDVDKLEPRQRGVVVTLIKDTTGTN